MLRSVDDSTFLCFSDVGTPIFPKSSSKVLLSVTLGSLSLGFSYNSQHHLAYWPPSEQTATLITSKDTDVQLSLSTCSLLGDTTLYLSLNGVLIKLFDFIFSGQRTVAVSEGGKMNNLLQKHLI